MAILRLARMRKRRRRKERLSELRTQYANAKTDDQRKKILAKVAKVSPMTTHEQFVQT